MSGLGIGRASMSGSSGRWLARYAILAVVVIGLSACVLYGPAAPERSFVAMDLLIGIQELPPGWHSRTPSNGRGLEFCVDDCADIGFDSDFNNGRMEAYQEVFRYWNSRTAWKVYEQNALVRGEPPPDWDNTDMRASRSKIACYDYGGGEVTCEWVGQYDEYIVIFFTWLIPDKMTLTDIENVVRAIDSRMTHYLSGAYQGTEDRSAEW